MDSTQLRALAAVARHRSFSGAAAELGLTQPGVSRQVQKAERELGVGLFIRRRSGVTLTAAGERVCAYAAEALERHQELLQAWPERGLRWPARSRLPRARPRVSSLCRAWSRPFMSSIRLSGHS